MATITRETKSPQRSATLQNGTRVRLRGTSHVVTLTADTGTIVRPDEYGYYVVRLDQPALYRHWDGRTEPLPELREAADNLEVLSDKHTTASGGLPELPTVVTQYAFVIDFRQAYAGRTPDELMRHYLTAMASGEHVDFTFRKGDQIVHAEVKIVGCQQVAPGLYRVVAEDVSAA